MKSVVFNEKEIESFKKSGVIKYAMLALATPIGLILSCVLAYINIDFMIDITTAESYNSFNIPV